MKVFQKRNCSKRGENGFDLEPQIIFGLTEAPYFQIAMLFMNRLSIQQIHRSLAVLARTQFSPLLEHGE